MPLLLFICARHKNIKLIGEKVLKAAFYASRWPNDINLSVSPPYSKICYAQKRHIMTFCIYSFHFIDKFLLIPPSPYRFQFSSTDRLNSNNIVTMLMSFLFLLFKPKTFFRRGSRVFLWTGFQYLKFLHLKHGILLMCFSGVWAVLERAPMLFTNRYK